MDAGLRDVFFYGLYMDPELLRGQGIEPGTPRRAHIDGFALHIGARATVVPRGDARVHGMVYTLDAEALRKLYAIPGLEAYRPEGVLAWVEGDAPRPVLCFRLAQAPAALERNEDYARRLRQVLVRLGFPLDYVASVASTADID